MNQFPGKGDFTFSSKAEQTDEFRLRYTARVGESDILNNGKKTIDVNLLERKKHRYKTIDGNTDTNFSYFRLPYEILGEAN